MLYYIMRRGSSDCSDLLVFQDEGRSCVTFVVWRAKYLGLVERLNEIICSIVRR